MAQARILSMEFLLFAVKIIGIPLSYNSYKESLRITPEIKDLKASMLQNIAGKHS